MVVPEWEGLGNPPMWQMHRAGYKCSLCAFYRMKTCFRPTVGKLSAQRQWYFPFKLGIRICPLRDSSSHTYAGL